MDNLRPFAAEPAIEAEPSSRIEQTFAHFEAQKFDAGGPQFAGGAATVSRESHDADAPAAPLQSFGKGDDLLLGAGDAVESGNHHGDVTQSSPSAQVASMRSS